MPQTYGLLTMVSSAYHKKCTEHLSSAEANMKKLQFREAAEELLKADQFAIHAVDMYTIEIRKTELITKGFDWKNFILRRQL